MIEESYDQGTWEHIKPQPKKVPVRNDGRPRHFVDIEALRRLVEAGFDGRPADVVGSFARKKKAEAAARRTAKAERAAKRAAKAKSETAE